MISQINDISKQQQSNINFTFQNQDNKLLISAESRDFQYAGFIESNQLISFDKIKKFLMVNNYEISLKTDQQLMISIGGLIDLQMKAQVKLTLKTLSQAIQKLNLKIEQEVQKNNKLRDVIDSQKHKIYSLNDLVKNLQNQLNSNLQRFTQQMNQLKQQLNDQKNQQKSQNYSFTEALNEQSLQTSKTTQRQYELKYNFAQLKNSFDRHQISIQQIEQRINQLKLNIVGQKQINLKKTKVSQSSNQQIQKEIQPKDKFFYPSKIVEKPEEKSIIRGFFPNQTISDAELLYRASDHEFSVKKFHEKCDGISNTFTVILTQFNKKIGGFTPLKWSSNKKGEYITDNLRESFIFSLTHGDKFTLEQPQKAIFNHNEEGPTFGRGRDLSVGERGNQSDQSYAEIGRSYKNSKYKHNDWDSMKRFLGVINGSFLFQVREWQVWRLEFK